MAGRHLFAACAAVVLLVLSLGGSATSHWAAAAPIAPLSQKGVAGTRTGSATLPQSPPPLGDIETAGGGGAPAASARSQQSVPHAVVAPEEIPWQVQVVDSTWGEATSLALDAAGYPHISYNAGGSLRYAYFDGTAWVTQSVDTAAFTGYVTSLALDSGGRAHISYCQGDGDLPRRCHSLRHAYYDGTQWHIEIVDGADGVGTYSSLALDSADRPHISYQDPFKVLKYAWYDGATWQTQSVDSSGWAGEGTSLALDATGRPHISYGLLDSDTSTYYLKYARYDGTAWFSQTVDSGGGLFSSLELDSLGQPHISYYGAGSNLNYARYDGSTWQIHVVDSGGDVGWGTSLALDLAGRPRITYWDRGRADLKYASYDGTAWQSQMVDGAGWVGRDSSLALDAAGRPHVSYAASRTGLTGLTYAEAQGSCLPVSAEMGWTPVSPTINLPVAFTSAANGSYPISFTWSFGDGGGSSDPNPSHAYVDTGTYTVQLALTNPCSQQSLQRALKVGCVPPWSAYFLSPPTPTVGLPAQFTATSMGSQPMTYTWAFGDGSYDAGQSVLHTYTSTGTFTVQMTATNLCGWHTVSNAVHVVPTYPTGAGFSWQPLTPTARVAFQFMGRADGAAPIEFAWDYGDGHAGSGVAPFHTYLISGTYSVAMTATNAYGQQVVQHALTVGRGSTWRIETVDSNAAEGPSLALDAGGQPHIGYSWGGLRYGRFDGNSWVTETVDSQGASYVSLALDAAGHPHVVYYDPYGTIRWAHFDGTSWNIQDVITVTLQEKLSMALDSAGRPHLSYRTDYNEGVCGPGYPVYHYRVLNYAYYDGTSWHTAVWAGPQGEAPRSPPAVEGWPCPHVYDYYYQSSLGLDAADQPHISYAHHREGPWGWPNYTHLMYDHATVDGSASAGDYASLALDSAGHPLISYYDAAAGDLKYARYDGTAWQIQVVDSAGDVGRFTSIAVDAAGQPHIAYYDGEGYLKYARFDGVSWYAEAVDNARYSPTSESSLALDAAGRPHITYLSYNQLGGVLKYAYTDECTPLAAATVLGPTSLPGGINGAYSAAYTPANPTPPVAFLWDNGATGPTAAYSWTVTGTHSVTVSVSNPCSQVATSLPVTVFCQPPLGVTIRGPRTLVPYLVGTYSAMTEPITASRPLTFTWDSGATGPNATYSWPATGTYTLTVVAENGCGQASNFFNVRVLAEWPWHFYLPLVLDAYTEAPCTPPQDASLTWEPLSPTVGTAVQFDASASGSSPLYFPWDFGDGGSGSDASATHTYALTGTCTVTLSASNACGQEAVNAVVVVGDRAAVRSAAQGRLRPPGVVDWRHRNAVGYW